MLFSIASAVVFATIALYMVMKGRKTLSFRMAWIPAVLSAMEFALCGALAMGEYPVLTAILMVCRITVFSCCSLAMKKDAIAARNRRRRREVFRRITADMYRAEMENVVPLRTCA